MLFFCVATRVRARVTLLHDYLSPDFCRDIFSLVAGDSSCSHHSWWESELMVMWTAYSSPLWWRTMLGVALLASFMTSNSPNSNLALEVTGGIWARYGADEDYLRDVTLVPLLYGAHLILSREHRHLIFVADPKEPRFIDTDRVEPGLNVLRSRLMSWRIKSTVFFLWSRERLGAMRR